MPPLRSSGFLELTLNIVKQYLQAMQVCGCRISEGEVQGILEEMTRALHSIAEKLDRLVERCPEKTATLNCVLQAILGHILEQ